MSSRRYSSKPAPASLAAAERSEPRSRSKNTASNIPEQRHAPTPDHRREYQEIQGKVYPQTGDLYYTQYEDERRLPQPSPIIPVFPNVSLPTEGRLTERNIAGSRRIDALAYSRRKEDIQRANNAEGGRVPHLSTERRPSNDYEGHTQGEVVTSQRHLHALSGDRGELARYGWQNGRLSPQSPVHSPSYILSSDDEDHQPHEYDNHIRRPGSDRSGHRRDEGPHTLQTVTSKPWRSDYSHHSRSHMRPPNAPPIPPKPTAHGPYAASPPSGYGKLSPVPSFPTTNSLLEKGKVSNPLSGLGKPPNTSPSISSPPTEDRQHRRTSRQPPSRTLVGSLPVPPAMGPPIPLLPENTESASSRQRSLVPASPITYPIGKWTSSVPSPPLSPLPHPDPSTSGSASATQHPPATPGKAISRSRRNTISKPDAVSSPATPYATAPEDSFHSHMASVPHMQGEGRNKDGRRAGHDRDVQNSNETRRRMSNPPPFRGEIPEYGERAQPSAVAKRKRRESNAASLVQQDHDAPSSASASTRSRRASLSAARAAQIMPVRDESQRFREHGAGRAFGTNPASALIRDDSRDTLRTGRYVPSELSHNTRSASRASKDDEEDPYTIIAVTESTSGYESSLQTHSEYEDRRSPHHQGISDGSDRDTPKVLYEEKKHSDLLAKLGLCSGDSRPVGLGLSVVHHEGEGGESYRVGSAENCVPVESYGAEDSTFPRSTIKSDDSRIPYQEPKLESNKTQESAYGSRRHPRVDHDAYHSRSPPFVHRYENSPTLHSYHSHASTPPESPVEIPSSASMTPKKIDRKRKSHRPPPLEIRRDEHPTTLRSPAIIVQEMPREDDHGARDSLANKPGTTVWTPVEEEVFHRSPWDDERLEDHDRDSTFSVPVEEERAAEWSEAESLSPGARKLFEGLQHQSSTHPRPEQISLQATTQKGYGDNPGDGSLPDTEGYPNIGRGLAFEGAKTWKGTLSVGAYDNLLERHGVVEMKRQDIIWELCETETSFVKSLKTILKLFVQPLRSNVAPGDPKAGKWIPGLPREPMKLFDWLDDIVQLHTQISSALHLARSMQYPVVLHIAEHLRPFVPRLELHLPYLARLEGVTEEIDKMARDPESDFGEFIRLQSSNPECENLGLSSFLLKPVQRLMKYPLFFKQLFEITPRSHPDHLPTFSLLHSTDLVIRVMQEVKAREEEYDYVKSLAVRIAGMPPGFKLARRERRLIAQGLLRRIFLNEREEAALDGLTPTALSSASRTPSSASASQPPTPQPSAPIPPSMHGIDVTKLGPVTSPYFNNQSTQALPTSPVYNYRRSFMSMISRASGVSDSSEWTASYSSHSSMVGPPDLDIPQRPDSIASSVAHVPYPNASPVNSPTLRALASKDHQKLKLRDVPVYAFVFSDLVILTVPNPEKQSSLRANRTAGAKDSMQLAEQIGVSRVLGVVDHSSKLDLDHLIAVDLLPMPQDQPDTGLLSADASSARPIYLTLPDKSNARLNLAPPQALADAKDKWVTAFQRCFRYTLRSLSFPLSTRYDEPADGVLGSEGHSRSSVMSILASGLPLPKSPSQQLFQSAEDASSVEDMIEGEREERGWWTLRFKKVLREMEQLGDPVMLIGDSALTMGYRPKRAQMPERTKRSGPQPLLLSTIASQSGSSGSKENRKSLLPSFKRR